MEALPRDAKNLRFQFQNQQNLNVKLFGKRFRASMGGLPSVVLLGPRGL